MRILHLFDTAGVGALLSRELDEMGHTSHVLQLKQLDPFGFGAYYKNTLYFNHTENLIQYARGVMDKYDRFIIHDQPAIIPEFKGNRIYMYWHGSVLRHSRVSSYQDEEWVGKHFMGTPDLLELRENSVWIPTPIDTRLFQRTLRDTQISKKAFTINQERNKELLYSYITKDPRFSRIFLEYFIREKGIIPYQKMPELFKRYGIYFDIKYDYTHPPKIVNELSATGLQALASGLLVYDGGLKPHLSLPFHHLARNSALKLIEHFN